MSLDAATATTTQVISKLAATFARFGVPEELVSDNGPQFTSAEFGRFSREFDFVHTTSSPHYAQSNGHAERAVQIAKGILKQSNPLLTLMVYRSTPNASTGFSPAELLMGRKIRTTLPTLSTNLDPSWPDREEMRSSDATAKLKQAFYYNRRNGVRDLPPLDSGDRVLMKLDNERQWTTPGTVLGNCSTPRSYAVVTPEGGCYRRNRRHVLQVPGAPTNPAADTSPEDPTPVQSSDVTPSSAGESPTNTGTVTVTRSGRVIKPPPKLDL
uniref:Integrase catalytic domain-containing protein n=1 Tax=Amphiprion percula TaxID=161767 RepID=A0A3P8SHE6_AMPPE